MKRPQHDRARDPSGKSRDCRNNRPNVGERHICTSIIVAAELRYGTTKQGSPRLTKQMESIFTGLEIPPFETPAEIANVNLRCKLESAGTPVGANDLLIAAHAIALGHTLVTDNEREFSRIDDLPLENWLRSG